MECHQLEQCAGNLQLFMTDYKAFIVDGLKLIDDSFVILRSANSTVAAEMLALIPTLSETLEVWRRSIVQLRIPSDMTLISWLKNRLSIERMKSDSGFSTLNESGMRSRTDTPDSFLESNNGSESSSQFDGGSDVAQSVVNTVESISPKLGAAISPEFSSPRLPADVESRESTETTQTAKSCGLLCGNNMKHQSPEFEGVVGESKSIIDLFKELATPAEKPNSAFEPIKLKQNFNVKSARKDANTTACQNQSKKETETPINDNVIENYSPHSDALNIVTIAESTSLPIEAKTEVLDNNAANMLPKQVRFSGGTETKPNSEMKSVAEILHSVSAFEKSGRSPVFSPSFGRGFSKSVANSTEIGVGSKPEIINSIRSPSQIETAKSPALNNTLYDYQDETENRKTSALSNDENYSPALKKTTVTGTDSFYSSVGAIQSSHPAFDSSFSKRSTRVRSSKIYSAGNHIVERCLAWRIDLNWPAWAGTSSLPERNMAPKYWCYLCESVGDLPGSNKPRFYGINSQQAQSLHGLLCHLTSRTHMRSLVAHVESGLPVQTIERKFWKEDSVLQVFVYKIIRKQLAKPDKEEIPLSPWPTEDYFVPFGPKPTRLAVGGACSTCFVRITNTFAEHAIVLRFECSTCSGRDFGSYLVKHEHTVLNGTHVAMTFKDFYLRPLQSADFLVRYWPAEKSSQVSADDSENEASNFLVALGFLVSFENADCDEAAIKAMPKTVFLCFEGDSESRHNKTQFRHSSAVFRRPISPVRVFGASKRCNNKGGVNRAQNGTYKHWQ